MDIDGWLRSFGLERYAAAFRENEIDAGVLPNLTADDLKDLGVVIVGHRRKMLDAINALRNETALYPDSKPPAEAKATAPTPPPRLRRTRRLPASGGI